MNSRILLFIITLALISIVTTLVYQKTQQADINYYQGRRLFEKGEYNKAIKFYEKALAIAPSRLDALEDLAYSYQRTARLEKAIDCFQKILSLQPEAYKIKTSLAQTYSWNKEYDRAIKIYEELLKLKQEDKSQEYQIKELLSEAYKINKNYERARGLYKEVLKKNRGNIKARVALADILSWLKEYDDSISEYEKALAIKPDDLEIKEKLAKVYTWKKDYQKAEDLYKDILKENPQNLDAHASLSQILIWSKRYTEAIGYIKLALSKKEDLKLRFLYGQALLFSGRSQEAQEALKDVIAQDPENIEAKTYLADALSYNKKFDEAISLYKEALREREDLEVKRKLADVLSWDRKYRPALDLYDELLAEEDDLKIRLQKARVLGWARKHNQSLKEYQKILDRKCDQLVELEMKAKEAYWNNRIKLAIGYYRELSEKEENVEAMFDLAQVYSYQLMGEEAIELYERILKVSPNHFRAKEALRKSKLVFSHVSLKTGYEFFSSDSQDRVNDIARNTFLNRLSCPVSYRFNIDLDHNITNRSFSDFPDVSEKEGEIKLTYLRNPCWWIDGFYSFFTYNQEIDTLHTFGASVNLRTFDLGRARFSYQRERLENSSTVIRNNYYSDNFKGGIDLDLGKRLKAGLDYLFSRYSDDNYKNEPGFDLLYYLSLEPRRFLLKYGYFYRDFDQEVEEYFSPGSFSTHTLTFNWRHFLNKEEVFWGANDLYYDLKYEIRVDSEEVVGYKLSGEINYDLNKRLNFNIEGSLADTVPDVYEDKKVTASLKYHF